MKKRILLTGAACALLLAACIPSVNPFYTEKDVVFEPRLLGEWHETGKTNDAQSWVFEQDGSNAYKLKISEPKGKEGQLSVHLFKLDKEYFLDLIPTDVKYAPDQTDLVSASMFPGHLVANVVQLEPTLKLVFFDFDKAQKFLEANPKALAHREEDHRMLLTADTRALQRFILKHLNSGDIFAEPGEMARKAD
jgi:hypothetical protein